MKQLSVIVPCYNVEGYLERCLTSLVHQNIDADAYEVLLIDDGSTDGTSAICDRYAAQYPQVQAIHQANAGLSVARNTGIGLANGKYLYFVDGDDFVAENCFKELLNIVNTNNLDVLMFGFAEVSDSSFSPSLPKTSVHGIRITTGAAFLKENFLHGAVWQYFVKRIIVEELRLRFPVGHMSEDNAFTLDVLLSAQRMAKISKICYYYVQHSDSIIHDQNIEHKKRLLFDYIYCSAMMKNVMKKYCDEIDEEALFRISSRCESFLYFAIDGAKELGCLDEVCRQMRDNGQLPLFPLDKRDFPGKKWTIIRLLSHSSFFPFALSAFFLAQRMCRHN